MNLLQQVLTEFNVNHEDYFKMVSSAKTYKPPNLTWKKFLTLRGVINYMAKKFIGVRIKGLCHDKRVQKDIDYFVKLFKVDEVVADYYHNKEYYDIQLRIKGIIGEYNVDYLMEEYPDLEPYPPRPFKPTEISVDVDSSIEKIKECLRKSMKFEEIGLTKEEEEKVFAKLINPKPSLYMTAETYEDEGEKRRTVFKGLSSNSCFGKHLARNVVTNLNGKTIHDDVACQGESYSLYCEAVDQGKLARDLLEEQRKIDEMTELDNKYDELKAKIDDRNRRAIRDVDKVNDKKLSKLMINRSTNLNKKASRKKGQKRVPATADVKPEAIEEDKSVFSLINIEKDKCLRKLNRQLRMPIVDLNILRAKVLLDLKEVAYELMDKVYDADRLRWDDEVHKYVGKGVVYEYPRSMGRAIDTDRLAKKLNQRLTSVELPKLVKSCIEIYDTYCPEIKEIDLDKYIRTKIIKFNRKSRKNPKTNRLVRAKLSLTDNYDLATLVDQLRSQGYHQKRGVPYLSYSVRRLLLS